MLFGNIGEGVDIVPCKTIIDYTKKAERKDMKKLDMKEINKPCLSSRMSYTVVVLVFGKIKLFK